MGGHTTLSHTSACNFGLDDLPNTRRPALRPIVSTRRGQLFMSMILVVVHDRVVVCATHAGNSSTWVSDVLQPLQ
jgi:hypothetical protein